ncbi:hypothetical protein JCM8547_005737 [Rhodosporidiobolus lusitaniae]
MQLIIAFSSFCTEQNGRLDFDHYELASSTADLLASISSDSSKASKVPSVLFRTNSLGFHRSRWDPATHSRLGALFDKLEKPVAVSLPSTPLGLSQTTAVHTLFPLYDALSEPREAITHLTLPNLGAQDLLGLRLFPHLRSLTLNSYTHSEVSISVFRSYNLPPLTHLALTSTSVSLSSASTLLALFSKFLAHVALNLYLLHTPYRETVNLAPLVKLDTLTFLFDSLEIFPFDAKWDILSSCLATASSSTNASKFKLVVTRHANLRRFVEKGCKTNGSSFPKRVTKDKRFERVRSVDTTALGGKFEMRG